MGAATIELESVGKRYRLGEHLGGMTDTREAMTARLFGRRAEVNELWALRDVSLTVDEGEVLGIVGRNGAGKSTFLKVVGGVTTPTVGVSRTRGRIGSLLEIGTGFNDELTGRENTYLSGAILGMRRAEIDRRLDEIVDFAGLAAFMDTPVKRYSSGMYLRLAFAVAAHLEADILLVDEVLAVGDADFRRRCLTKMSEVGASGRTVLFASHNLDALAQLCTRAVWFDEGRITRQGPAVEVVRRYLDSSGVRRREIELDVDGSDDGQTGPARLRRIAVLGDDHTATSTLLAGDHLAIELEVEVIDPTPAVDVAVVLERANGPVLLDENLAGVRGDRPTLERRGRHRLRMTLPPMLTPADYTIGVWLGTAYDDIHFHERILTFTIDGDDPDRSDRLLAIDAGWTSELIDPGGPTDG